MAEKPSVIVFKQEDKIPIGLQRTSDYYKKDPKSAENARLENKINADMFNAIYHNDFDYFKKLSEQVSEKDVSDVPFFYGGVLNRKFYTMGFGYINALIDINETIKNLGLDPKSDDKYMGLQDYILNRLEKKFSTYNSDEQEKKDIQALWNILTYSLDDAKFANSWFNESVKKKRSEDFQTFLRKIMGNYKPIDDVIGKEEKDAFIEKYLDKNMIEKLSLAKQGISNKFSSAKQGISDKFGSLNPFRNKTGAAPAPVTTDAAPAPAPVTTDAASAPVTTAPTGEAPAKKGFLSGLSNPFGKKPDATEAPKKSMFSWGGRKSRKQRKSKKQRKSRKQRKTRK